MISWTFWQRTAQEPRNSETRKMWIYLPVMACGAKARICHSCLVSRPWRSESMKICRSHDLRSAVSMSSWGSSGCFCAFTMALCPRLMLCCSGSVCCWDLSLKSAKYPSALIFAYFLLALRFLSSDKLGAIPERLGSCCIFKAQRKSNFIQWTSWNNDLLGKDSGALRQDQGDYAAPKFGGCN